MSRENLTGQLWESVAPNARTHGLCLAVGPSDSTESPGSWIMMRLSDGKTLFMHQINRRVGQWVRRGVLARLEIP